MDYPQGCALPHRRASASFGQRRKARVSGTRSARGFQHAPFERRNGIHGTVVKYDSVGCTQTKTKQISKCAPRSQTTTNGQCFITATPYNILTGFLIVRGHNNCPLQVTYVKPTGASSRPRYSQVTETIPPSRLAKKDYPSYAPVVSNHKTWSPNALFEGMI